MSFNRSFTLITSGLVLMILSGFAGYYWASSSVHSGRITPRKNVQPQNETAESTKEPTKVTEVDTDDLTPTSWKAFLRYEGKRTRMLGIKKSYTNVNFRSGPGTEYAILATPDGGTLLMPLDRIENWYRSRLPDGTIGWIHKSLVRILQVPEPVAGPFRQDLPSLKKSIKEQIPDEFQDNNRIRVTAPKVNLRQGPGVQFAIAGRLYEHQEARLLGKRKNWYRVRNSYGTLGWVRADLIEPVWLTDPEDRKNIEVTTTDLRMSPEYQFREAIARDEPVEATLLERQSPWFLVKIGDGSIGWIHEQEVKGSAQLSSSTPD